MPILYYNLGNSDVVFKEIDKQRFREATMTMYQKIKKEELNIFNPKEIDFPILKPTLNFLEKHSIPIKELKVVLFATDQKPPHNQDTVWGAEIFREYFRKRAIKCEIVKIIQNPADYDLMLRFYHEYVRKHYEVIEQTDKNIIALSPGTPALTLGLTTSFMPFLRNTDAVYVARDGEVSFVEILKTLMKRKWVDIIKESVKDYDYEMAAKILEASNIRERILKELFLCLHYRLNFHFRLSNEHFQRFKMSVPFHPVLKRLESELSDLLNRKIPVLLSELCFNIEIKFSKQQYTEAIALLFRLQEEKLKLEVERLLNIKIKMEDGKFRKFVATIEKEKELKEYLRKENIKYDRPNRLTYSKILEFFIKERADKRRELEKLLKFSKEIGEMGYSLDKPKSLCDLRNRSPYGHEFYGISKEEIDLLYKGRILNELRNFINLPLGKHSYELVNEYIFQELDRIE